MNAESASEAELLRPSERVFAHCGWTIRPQLGFVDTGYPWHCLVYPPSGPSFFTPFFRYRMSALAWCVTNIDSGAWDKLKQVSVSGGVRRRVTPTLARRALRSVP